MRRIKKGDMVQIIKPLCVRKSNGKIASFTNRVVEVKRVEVTRCCCDLGLDCPVYIPSSHLRKVA